MSCKKFAILIFLFACGCSIVPKQEVVLAEKSIQIEKSAFFVSVPLTKFSSIQSPCVNIEIDGKTLSMELDLGYQGDLTVTEESMNFISSKVFIREKPMYGIRGKEYPTNLYRIPKIKIGAMTFFRPILQEGRQEFIKDSSFVQNGGEPSPRESGRLGWELFYNTNLLIDIKNFRIVFCDSVDTLKREGYAIENFIKTPLFLERGLVEFEAETSKGLLRCMLDTGTTWNILNIEIEEGSSIDKIMWEPENVLDYAFFKIDGNDFGPIAFHRIPVQIPIRIEAVLGMEFFQNHPVFLDFAGECAYFSKK